MDFSFIAFMEALIFQGVDPNDVLGGPPVALDTPGGMTSK